MNTTNDTYKLIPIPAAPSEIEQPFSHYEHGGYGLWTEGDPQIWERPPQEVRMVFTVYLLQETAAGMRNGTLSL
ncbi:hypothetical protein EYF80_049243 [Liparis tanakae]|uniref:Uncharacterized protein n=1 Tax=Liparis tanakae TaxID=230148 RepID=A0A4Z2FII7_9TELE|nr:hypothetical protein EYF80_049243 [Liparis tanakae]